MLLRMVLGESAHLERNASSSFTKLVPVDAQNTSYHANDEETDQHEIIHTGLTCLQKDHNNSIISFNTAYLVVLVDAFRRTQYSNIAH